MTTTASEQRRGGWLVLLLAAVLTGIVTVLLGVANPSTASAATVSTGGSSSASSIPAPQTRVGVSTPDSILAVGGHETIAAGQGRGDGLSQSYLAVGCCVAAAGASGASDLATVTEHLGNIDAMTPPNAAMLSRIQEAISSGRPLTPGEQNFMTHELTESQLTSSGVPQDLAHEMAGQTHPTFANYDPEVIKQFPNYFNSNWRAYWGLPQ